MQNVHSGYAPLRRLKEALIVIKAKVNDKILPKN